MPPIIKSSKILQKLYIRYYNLILIEVINKFIPRRYLSRRFKFLEDCPGYCYNTGAGADLSSNSVALGRTLVDAMITEVDQMCEQSWSSRVYQQVSKVYIFFITSKVCFYLSKLILNKFVYHL